MTIEDRSLQAPTMVSQAPTLPVAQRGSTVDAFREIFAREFDYVWSSLRRLGVQERDLEDVAQNIFVEVHRLWDRYDPTRPIRPWLFAFAVRFAADYRKQARHRIELFDEHADAIGGSPSADDVVVADEARRMISEALESLDLGRRAVFILHELDEIPMAEIALSLEIPVNTAYSRLRVAREEFTAAIRRIQLRRGGR